MRRKRVGVSGGLAYPRRKDSEEGVAKSKAKLFAFSPRLDHLDEAVDSCKPRYNMRLASMQVCDGDNRPVEAQEFVE